jgi:hypothetical protein
VLEFTASLQSNAEDSPAFLFDKLRRSDLLFVGTHFAEWLTRLVARNPVSARLVDAAVHGSDAPVLFVEQATGVSRTLPGCGASDFVSELRERWAKLEASSDAPPPEGLSHLAEGAGMPPGAVVLSCALSDRDETEALRAALDRAGVDVILDNDDVELPEKWEMKLRHHISECSLFVPVVSSRCPMVRRRWARAEWIDTVLHFNEANKTRRYVLPVVIDDTTPEAAALPEVFKDLPWERMIDGRPSADFVETIVRLQRSYRRASYA